MFVAENEKGERVYANKSLPKNEIYFCPICRERVRLRVGDHNAPHFYHTSPCSDDFTHDMSEWHMAWQEMFPLVNREVVIEYNGEIHRADVLCYGTVIEFQHSPISESEFNRRNAFYTQAGYKLVWIFDQRDAADANRLVLENEWSQGKFKGGIFSWKYPQRFLSNFLPQNEKIALFFQTGDFGNNPKDIYAEGYMGKVIAVDTLCKTTWSKFYTSDNVMNYADLVRWLKYRWDRKNGTLPPEWSQKVTASKYLHEGKVVDSWEVEEYLEENEPYCVIRSRTPNKPRYGIGPCSNGHQSPYIDENHCILGCYKCLAVVEDGREKYIYCKLLKQKGSRYDARMYTKIK